MPGSTSMAVSAGGASPTITTTYSFDLLTQLASAKTGKNTVNVYQENGIIKQVYVL